MEKEEPDISDNETEDTIFLVNSTTQKPVPLHFVENLVKIEGSIAEIKFIQYYYNDEKTSIETEYIFPVHVNCTFTGLEARFEDQVITSKVFEREKAKIVFEAAVSSGDIAFLAQPWK